jgi:putative sporulation protein YtxC
MKVKLEDKKVVVSCKKHVKACLKNIIVPVLMEFIVTMKEAKWMTSLLQKQFYYEDEVEVAHIVEIAKNILHGKRKEDEVFTFTSTRKKQVAIALENFLSFSVSFSIEAFFQFRLKSYIHRLSMVVQRAIDEYQLEQEYQVFINELRTRVNESEGEVSSIHVVYHNGFTFYDGLYQVIETPVFDEIEGGIDTEVLAPLLHFAPRNVYLYTATLDVPIIITVLSVFQDRVTICEPQQFYSRCIQESERGENEIKYTKELDF